MADNIAKAVELKNQGNAAFQQRDFPKAVELFTQAIELNPNDHVFFSNRSGAYASMGQWDKALEDAESCIKIKPDWAKGYTRKGLALFNTGRLEDALETYEAGLKLDPQNSGLQEGVQETRNAIAWRQQQQQQRPPSGNPMADAFGPDMISKLEANPKTSEYMKDPAFVELMKSVQSDPSQFVQHLTDPRVQEAMSVLLGIDLSMDNLQRQQEEEEARRRKAEDEAREARRREEERKQKEEEERKQKAEEERIAQMTPEEREAHEKSQQAHAIKDEGNALFKQRKFQEAKAKYEEARALDPTQAAFLGNLATVSLAEGKYEECIQQCKDAIKLGKEHKTMDYKLLSRLLLRIANALLKLERFDEALEYVGESLLEDRTSAGNRLLKTIEVAKKKFEDEAYLDPEKSEEAKERGNEHFREGRWREAIEEYTDSIRRDPTNHRSLANRAACWIKIMEWERALEDCDACLKLDPTFLKAYIRKANVQVFLKKYHQALDTYEQALQIEPNSAELLQGRMEVYQKINQENASGAVDPQRAQEAMKDPEIQAILRNPVMDQVLQDLGPKGDKERANKALQNPEIMGMLEKLIAAGIVRTG